MLYRHLAARTVSLHKDHKLRLLCKVHWSDRQGICSQCNDTEDKKVEITYLMHRVISRYSSAYIKIKYLLLSEFIRGTVKFTLPCITLDINIYYIDQVIKTNNYSYLSLVDIIPNSFKLFFGRSFSGRFQFLVCQS